jgi:hypothetical protein
MKRKILVLLTLCMMIGPGCDSTDPDEPFIPKIGMPRNLLLNQDDENSFFVRWIRAANDTLHDTVRIKTDGASTQGDIIIIPFPDTVALFTAPAPFTGATYSITVSSRDSISQIASINLPDPVKGTPRNLILTKLDGTSFLATWTRAQADNTSDTIHIVKEGTSEKWEYIIPSPNASFIFVEEELVTSSTYVVTVSSRNSTSNLAVITLEGRPTDQPTDLRVTSISDSQIGARWMRDPLDKGADTLIARPVGGGQEITIAVNSPGNAAIIGGLSQGVLYKLQAASTDGRSEPIEWATATRSEMLTLYETTDKTAGHFSGLILGPTAKVASPAGAEKNQIDLVLATDTDLPSPSLSLQGADVVGSGIPGGRASRIGELFFPNQGGLDQDFYFASIAELFSKINALPIQSEPSPPLIVLIKTADDHFARIAIMPQSDGLLWKYVGSYRAIDVIVSYQTLVGVGYASRPTNIRRGTNTPKVIGARKGVK